MSNPLNDIDRGKSAMEYFHNQASKYPENYRFTFPSLIDYCNAKSPAFLEGLGFAIGIAGMSDPKVKAAMERVADAGRGRLPEKLNDFFNSLQSEAVKISAWDAFKEISVDSIGDAIQGAAAVGNTVISTASITLKMIPFLLAGGAALYVYLNVKARV